MKTVTGYFVLTEEFMRLYIRVICTHLSVPLFKKKYENNNEYVYLELVDVFEYTHRLNVTQQYIPLYEDLLFFIICVILALNSHAECIKVHKTMC